MTSPPLPAAPRRSRAITWRSISLGLVLAVLINLITPYNDYVVNNSFIVGIYFPPIVALAMLAIVLLINGPLHRFAPRLALRAPELALVLAIALVSCAVPAQGLLRMLLPTMVAPVSLAQERPDYLKLLHDMKLPDWLFAASSVDGGSELSVRAFYARLNANESIPWSAWVKPLIGWGIFVAGFFTTLISIACLVRFQWAVNERLPFPIAQLQSMMVAEPAPGRAFNALFSSPVFWIALAAVFVIESSVALHAYFPLVPEIPTSYDMTTVLSNEPWNVLPYWLKRSSIYFTFLGLSYFTQTKVSFSLWGTVLLVAFLRWPFATQGADLPDGAYLDQALGASFAFIAGVFWIGRHHWAVIGRALLGRPRPGDAQGAFANYRLTAIALLMGLAVMAAWLSYLGCSPWLTVLIIVMILFAHIITARVVAETGLAFLRVHIGMDQILTSLPANLLTPREMFLYGAAHYNFMQSGRESLLTFSLHGLNVVDETRPLDQRRTLPWIAGALVVALIACVIASLWCYYSYAVPLDNSQHGMLNIFGLRNWPLAFLVDYPTNVARGFYASKSQNTFLQIGIGIAIMVSLQALTWRFSRWPLLPVGYLLCTSWYLTTVWFSLLLGWLAKTLILRFGGASLFNQLKPLFVGLIFGEALATGAWLIVNLLVAVNGYEPQITRFLPQ